MLDRPWRENYRLFSVLFSNSTAINTNKLDNTGQSVHSLVWCKCDASPSVHVFRRRKAFFSSFHSDRKEDHFWIKIKSWIFGCRVIPRKIKKIEKKKKKSLLSSAASTLDQGFSLSFKTSHYAHKTSHGPEDANIVNCVYKHLLRMKKEPTSNLHSGRERERDREREHDWKQMMVVPEEDTVEAVQLFD